MKELDDFLARAAGPAAGSDGARAVGAALGRMVSLIETLPETLAPDAEALVDTVCVGLCEAAPEEDRVRAARAIAPRPGAPPRTLRRLAADASLAVSGPILSKAPRLDDEALAAIAREGGHGHRLAIAQRRAIAPAVSDALLESGDASVVRSLVLNEGASFSERGLDALVQSAKSDERLQASLRNRADLPASHLRAVVALAKGAAQERMGDRLGPAEKVAIAAARRRQDTQPLKPDTSALGAAVREVEALAAAGGLNELRLAVWAEARERERALAGLARLARVPLPRAEQLLFGPEADSLLLVCRALGFEARTAAALLAVGTREGARPRADVKRYDAISAATAKRVLGLMQRPPQAAADAPAAPSGPVAPFTAPARAG